MPTLDGRVVIVTGGSRGIGFATARMLIEAGARVAITATSEVTLRAAAADLEAVAGAAVLLPLVADVREPADVDKAIAQTADRFGGVDALVNNAGVGIFRDVVEMALDEWSAVIETNLTGVFHCCRAVLPHLRRRGGGWIINVSSLSGSHPFAGGAAYCASKAALDAFAEALMQEVRHDGVRVACVAPGSVRTEFRGRAVADGQDEWKLAPTDVAHVIVDLMSHPARSLPSRVEVRPARPPRKG